MKVFQRAFVFTCIFCNCIRNKTDRDNQMTMNGLTSDFIFPFYNEHITISFPKSSGYANIRISLACITKLQVSLS